MRRLIPLTLLCVASVAQQTPDYFPLQVGNQWIYQGTGIGASSRTIEVTDRVTVAGQTYFVVKGFTVGDARVRRDDNRLLVLDPASSEEKLLEDFAAPVAASFPTAMAPCTTEARISDRSGGYNGPIGRFDGGMLIIDYTGACADAGITRDIFLPWVGLVRRTETSFAGPRVYDLIYTRVGTALQASAPLLSFGLALDRKTYAVGAPLTARLTLRNTQPDPIVLEFGSGQEYDLTIQDEAGKEGYRWSAGRGFTQVLHALSVSGEKNWVIEIRLPTALGPGKYVSKTWLTTMGTPAKKYSASTAFEIAK